VTKPTRALLFRLATSDRFEEMVRRVPGGERWAWRAASRYVAGRDRADALRTSDVLAARGLAASVDFFGEQVTNHEEARRSANVYVALARAIEQSAGDVWLSIDLSHVGLDISPELCRHQLERVAAAMPPGRRIQVGAEDSGRNPAILEVVLKLAADNAPMAATVQANLRRSHEDALRLVEASVPIRLVKGAYVEPPEVAHAWGKETDAAYVRLARDLHAAGAELSLATHDRGLRETLLPELPQAGVEQLLGVREEDAVELVRRGRLVRLYVPFGEGWFRYWMRRTAEARGA
jgi:proline dehydrogenase